MKNPKKPRKILLILIVVFGLSLTGIAQPCPGVKALNNNLLVVVNTRSCDVTLNYEVSDCGTPSLYCNSRAQVGLANPNGTFVLLAGNSVTIDIQAQFGGTTPTLLDCTWYNTGAALGDINVNLFEIDYVAPPSGGGPIYGSVSNGCSGCFSSTQLSTGTNSPVSCNNSWSMSWTNTATGIQVDIN